MQQHADCFYYACFVNLRLAVNALQTANQKNLEARVQL